MNVVGDDDESKNIFRHEKIHLSTVYLVYYVNLKHLVFDSFWETNPLRTISNNMKSRCLTPNLNPEI
jgi:hypothetical protein